MGSIGERSVVHYNGNKLNLFALTASVLTSVIFIACQHDLAVSFWATVYGLKHVICQALVSISRIKTSDVSSWSGPFSHVIVSCLVIATRVYQTPPTPKWLEVAVDWKLPTFQLRTRRNARLLSQVDLNLSHTWLGLIQRIVDFIPLLKWYFLIVLHAKPAESRREPSPPLAKKVGITWCKKTPRTVLFSPLQTMYIY